MKLSVKAVYEGIGLIILLMITAYFWLVYFIGKGIITLVSNYLIQNFNYSDERNKIEKLEKKINQMFLWNMLLLKYVKLEDLGSNISVEDYAIIKKLKKEMLGIEED